MLQYLQRHHYVYQELKKELKELKNKLLKRLMPAVGLEPTLLSKMVLFLLALQERRAEKT